MSAKRSSDHFGVEMAKMLPILMRAVSNKFNEVTMKGKLTVSNILLVDILTEKGACTMSELARSLDMSMSSVTAIVDKMISSGFLRRERSEKDRRVVIVSLDKKGKDLSNDLYQMRKNTANELYSVLSSSEKREYLRMVKKVCTNILKGAFNNAKLLLLIFVLSVVPLQCSFAAEMPDSSSGSIKVNTNKTGLSLRQCVDITINNSYDVKLAKLDMLVSETDMLYAEAVFDTFAWGDFGYSEDKRAQISPFASDDTQTNTYSAGLSKELPSGTEISVSWIDTRVKQDTIYVDPGLNPSHNAELTLEARQPVAKNFFGMIDRGDLNIAKLAIMNADLNMKDRIEGTIAAAMKAYWRLVYASDSVAIYERMCKRAEDLYDSQKKNYDLGIIEKGDLLASEANLYGKRTGLMLARNSYKRAMENLKLIMNIDPSLMLTPVDDLALSAFDHDLETSLKLAFDNSRSYAMAKRRVSIKDIDVKLKENAVLPEIDLVGTMSMNGIDRKYEKAAARSFNNDNSYYYAGLEVSWPLENSSARGDKQRADAEKKKAVVELKKVERSLITEVTNSHRDVSAYYSASVNSNKTVRLQSEKLDVEETRFSQGRSNIKRLIDYQNDLLLSEMAEAKDLRDLRLAEVDLLRAMNVILEQYGELE